MNIEQRMQEVNFIESDIKERGEERVSNITFFACIYQTKVKVNGKSKTVKYSGADNVLKGYRPINLKNNKINNNHEAICRLSSSL